MFIFVFHTAAKKIKNHMLMNRKYWFNVTNLQIKYSSGGPIPLNIKTELSWENF